MPTEPQPPRPVLKDPGDFPPPPILGGLAETHPGFETLSIANNQVALCWAVFAQLMAGGIAISHPIPSIALVSSLIFLATAIAAFACYRTLFGIFWAIMLTLLTLLPIIGIFVLIGSNSVATRRLQDAGLRVGFMGVSGTDRAELRASIDREIAAQARARLGLPDRNV